MSDIRYKILIFYAFAWKFIHMIEQIGWLMIIFIWLLFLYWVEERERERKRDILIVLYTNILHNKYIITVIFVFYVWIHNKNLDNNICVWVLCSIKLKRSRNRTSNS